MPRKPDLGRRAEIAERAFEVIRERGVRGVTMSEIAAGLDMKRPTLYWYFKDLGEIFMAVLELTYTREMEFVAARLQGIEHPLDLLEATMRAMHEFTCGQEELVLGMFQLWAAGGSEDPDRVIAKALEFFEPVREMAIGLLQEGIEGGQVLPCDPARIVDLAVAVVDGLVLHRVTRRVETEPLLEAAIEGLLEPLRAPAGQTGGSRS